MARTAEKEARMRGSYVPNFKAPGRRKPSGLMWVTALLCVALPPVGLVLLWGFTRCPLRGKLLLTLVSALIMTSLLTLYMLRNQTAPPTVPEPPVVTYGIPTPEPTPTPSPSPTPAPSATPALPPGVVPANPVS